MGTTETKKPVALVRTGRSRWRATRQDGSIIVVTVLSLVVLVGMMGFVADLGHLYVDKTRLQNGLDAAALSAAMTLSADLDCSNAVTAGNSTLAQMQATNKDLNKIANLTWTFASTLSSNSADWMAPSASNCDSAAHFVRVSADLPGLTVFFLQVLGMGTGQAITKETAAAAVAGTRDCPANIIPVGACATDGGTPPNTADPNKACSSDTNCYGYQLKKEYCVKPGAAATGNGNNTDWSCGAGDLSGWFNWLALGGTGASHLAGELRYDSSPSGNVCIGDKEGVPLESGNISSSQVRNFFNERLDPHDLDANITDPQTRRKLANCWRGDLGYCDPTSSATGQQCDPAATPPNQLTGFVGIPPGPPGPNMDNCVWDEGQLRTSTFNKLSFVNPPNTINSADNPADANGVDNNPQQADKVLQYPTNNSSRLGFPQSLYDAYKQAWINAFPNGTTPDDLNDHTSPRLVVIPVLDCSSATNSSAKPVLLGYMCGFITRAIPKSSGVGVENRIAMEFVRGCGNLPRTPIKIVLYKDPFRRDE